MNSADPIRAARPRRLARWMLVLLLLVVAAAIALWPREQHDGVNPTTTTPAVPSPPAENDAALAEPRQHASLQPCPTPTSTDAAAGPLAGLTVPCLGDPGTVNLGAALAGRPVLLNFWASWCVPCREEMPVLAAYAAQPGAVTVLGVDVQDEPSAALGLMTDLGVHYSSVYDPDRAVQRALAVPPVLPVSYLVRPDGSAQRITQPLVFSSPNQIRDVITNELAGDR